MNVESSDCIEKSVQLRAPVSRVWRAITDATEFGEWFRVKLEGGFEVGRPVVGNITYPGYENLRFEATVERMEPETLFSFTWHPVPQIQTPKTRLDPRRLSSSVLRTWTAAPRSR